MFQTQDSVDTAAATILADYKDPKWYAELSLQFNPVPLEIGDSISWVLDLAVAAGSSLYGFGIYGTAIYGTAAVSATLTGIIRAIDISDGAVRYRCEVAPGYEIISGSASASSSL